MPDIEGALLALRGIVQLEELATSPADWQGLAELYLDAGRNYPGDHRLLANAANAFWLSGDAACALTHYKQAVLLAPDSHVIYRGLGNALVDLGQYHAAERAYRRSLTLCAADETHWNLSQLLIGMGRHEEGYNLAESRWGLPRVSPWRPDPIDRLDQVLDPEQSLLVWSEQGFGDILQHLRWLPLLQEQRGTGAAALHLEVEGCLEDFVRSLVQDFVPRPVVLAKPPQGPKSWIGRHVPLLSLPKWLGCGPIKASSTALSLRDWPVPVADPHRVKRVGLVWAAGRKLEEPLTAREYWVRSLDPTSLGRLIEGITDLDCRCLSLQFGDDRSHADPWLERLDGELPADADFEATARLVAELDLVITVDTAMAHLAGLLQRPVWVLLPYSPAPRWGQAASTSIWYPTMQLFRQQQPWIWHDPIEKVIAALATQLDQRSLG
jgi:tetratricopeptide (TPR) repeat protein